MDLTGGARNAEILDLCGRLRALLAPRPADDRPCFGCGREGTYRTPKGGACWSVETYKLVGRDVALCSFCERRLRQRGNREWKDERVWFHSIEDLNDDLVAEWLANRLLKFAKSTLAQCNSQEKT